MTKVSVMNSERQMMHGGRLIELAQKSNKSVESFIDFSASINPFGLDKGLITLLEKSIYLLEHYPNTDYSVIKNLLAKKHSVKSENIYLGNGANSIIYRFLQAFDKKINICIPVPSFETYNLAAKAISEGIFYYYMPDMMISSDIFDILSDSIDVLLLANPNNPTGFLINKELLGQIIKYCVKKNIFILIDECFLEFVKNGETFSQSKNLRNYSNIAILRSLTKFYAFPGLRFGYLLINNKKLHKRLDLLTPEWEINTLALEAAKYSLEQNMDTITDKIQTEKTLLEADLRSLGIYVYPSCTNFLLCRYNRSIVDELLKSGIIVRDCSDFIGLDYRYFRVAVKTRSENKRLYLAIKAEVGK